MTPKPETPADPPLPPPQIQAPIHQPPQPPVSDEIERADQTAKPNRVDKPSHPDVPITDQGPQVSGPSAASSQSSSDTNNEHSPTFIQHNLDQNRIFSSTRGQRIAVNQHVGGNWKFAAVLYQINRDDEVLSTMLPKSNFLFVRHSTSGIIEKVRIRFAAHDGADSAAANSC